MHANSRNSSLGYFRHPLPCVSAFFHTVPSIDPVNADLIACIKQLLDQPALICDIVGRCSSVGMGPRHSFSWAVLIRNEKICRFRIAFEFEETVKVLKPEVLPE